MWQVAQIVITASVPFDRCSVWPASSHVPVWRPSWILEKDCAKRHIRVHPVETGALQCSCSRKWQTFTPGQGVKHIETELTYWFDFMFEVSQVKCQVSLESWCPLLLIVALHSNIHLMESWGLRFVSRLMMMMRGLTRWQLLDLPEMSRLRANWLHANDVFKKDLGP